MTTDPKHKAEPGRDPDSMAELFTVPDDEDVEPGTEEYPTTADGRQDDGED